MYPPPWLAVSCQRVLAVLPRVHVVPVGRGFSTCVPKSPMVAKDVVLKAAALNASVKRPPAMPATRGRR